MRLGWKRLTVANTVAIYGIELITITKSIIIFKVYPGCLANPDPESYDNFHLFSVTLSLRYSAPLNSFIVPADQTAETDRLETGSR